jgi:hypothetical protein
MKSGPERLGADEPLLEHPPDGLAEHAMGRRSIAERHVERPGVVFEHLGDGHRAPLPGRVGPQRIETTLELRVSGGIEDRRHLSSQ